MPDGRLTAMEITWQTVALLWIIGWVGAFVIAAVTALVIRTVGEFLDRKRYNGEFCNKKRIR